MKSIIVFMMVSWCSVCISEEIKEYEIKKYSCYGRDFDTKKEANDWYEVNKAADILQIPVENFYDSRRNQFIWLYNELKKFIPEGYKLSITKHGDQYYRPAYGFNLTTTYFPELMFERLSP